MSKLSVGLHDFKARLSEYLCQVKSGHTIVITEHRPAAAEIVPAHKSLDEQIQTRLASGSLDWNGLPLPPVTHRARVRGKKTVADLLIEDRE